MLASRALGASPELAEIISEIVVLGDHLCHSGYCPELRLLPVPYSKAWMSAGGCRGGRWACFYSRALSVERASGVASRAGSRDAVVGFHDSRVNEGALSSEIPQMRRLSFTADCTALGVRPRRAEPLTFGGCGSQLPSAPVAALPSLGPYTLGGWSSGLSALLEVFQCEAKGKPNTNYTIRG